MRLADGRAPAASGQHLSREVADSMPGDRYIEIARCGHYGYLEQPTALNAAIIDFFASPER